MKHYLEAVVGGALRWGYRIICENPAICSDLQAYKPNTCIFQDQFPIHGFNMFNWPEEEIILGRLEMTYEGSSPAPKPWGFPQEEPQESKEVVDGN